MGNPKDPASYLLRSSPNQTPTASPGKTPWLETILASFFDGKESCLVKPFYYLTRKFWKSYLITKIGGTKFVQLFFNWFLCLLLLSLLRELWHSLQANFFHKIDWFLVQFLAEFDVNWFIFENFVEKVIFCFYFKWELCENREMRKF